VIIPDHTYAILQASERRDIHLGEYLSEQYGVEVKDLAVRTGLARLLRCW
jgi:hypothetical protein